jgi:uncharacterized damage-inducible protein DinB
MLTEVASLREIFSLNTRLLLNCLHGVSEDDAVRRPLPGVNSLAFVTAHVVDARHFVLTLLDRPAPNPLTATLGRVTRIEEVTELPALGALREFWVAVSAALDEGLDAVGVEHLRSRSPQRFPVSDATRLGGLAFLAQHESYHVGQLALLRKCLGYPAMAYAAR